MKKKKIFQIIIVCLFWLLVWQGISIWMNNNILMVGPIETLQCLAWLLPQKAFWQTILQSLLRIGAGLLVGALLGSLSASISYKWNWHRILFHPLITAMKAVPVASFVIILLIWFGSENVAMLISFLVVYPILYINVLTGLDTMDPSLIEMARVFHMRIGTRIRTVYLPGLRAVLLSGFSLAVGMGIKSGVAAEVIGQAKLTMGNSLYRAKINLETGDLIAWTFVIVILSWLLEKGIRLIIKLIHKQMGVISKK